TLEVGAMPTDVFVSGAPEGPRTTISLVLRYCLAASPLGASVRIGVAREPQGGTVVVEAPQAPPLPAGPDRSLFDLVGRPERALGGDGALILAGAIATHSGGEIVVSSPAGQGLRFKLRF